MRVDLSEGARLDLQEAADWYAERSVVATSKFIAEYERVRDLIVENPLVGATVRPNIRRVIFRKFPFSLVYEVWPEHVLVIAVVHHARDPEYWHERR